MKSKKQISVLLMLAFLPFIGFAKVTILRKGSLDGIHYDRVQETRGLFNQSLSCTGAGTTTCGWMSSFSVPSIYCLDGYLDDADITTIEGVIQTAISNGNTSGHTVYSGGVDVYWTGTSLSEIDIDIYPDGE